MTAATTMAKACSSLLRAVRLATVVLLPVWAALRLSAFAGTAIAAHKGLHVKWNANGLCSIHSSV